MARGDVHVVRLLLINYKEKVVLEEDVWAGFKDEARKCDQCAARW